MASDERHTVYNVEDLDDEDEDVDIDSQNDPVEDDDDDVEDDDDDSTSSSNLPSASNPRPPPPPPLPPPPTAQVSSAGEVTIAVAGVPTLSAVPDPKRQRVDSSVVVEEKKAPLPLDESRRLFQRLWTDEDEIELLQGFLDYTSSRGPHQHHDTSAFYDQIKNKLQLDFNKNQLVEKLRRLKKKYRNVLGKISSGKEYVFKSPHDQSTFEISCKIWSGVGGRVGAPVSHVAEDAGFDDDDATPNPNLNSIPHDHTNNNGIDINSSERKGSRARKRSRGVKVEERPHFFSTPPMPQPVSVGVPTVTAGSIPTLIEETVKSCLSPLFKELLHSVMNGSCNSRGFGLSFGSMPVGFGIGPVNFMGGGDVSDEKWRKQQILELEVYSKRLELVQDQIKAQLEELRSMGSS